jgi:hypothetical protein
MDHLSTLFSASPKKFFSAFKMPRLVLTEHCIHISRGYDFAPAYPNFRLGRKQLRCRKMKKLGVAVKRGQGRFLLHANFVIWQCLIISATASLRNHFFWCRIHEAIQVEQCRIQDSVFRKWSCLMKVPSVLQMTRLYGWQFLRCHLMSFVSSVCSSRQVIKLILRLANSLLSL